MNATGSTGPLAGIRIIEIASLAPAPFGCMLLADLGADVIRIDRATGGPAVSGPPGPLDRGRRTIALDLKSAAGVEAVRSLARLADVFVEGFRPGVAERLGIGPDVLRDDNARLIYARMTGYGQTGPLAQQAGHDINYVAIAGALEPLGRAGEAPHPALNILGDFAGGGAFLALGILAALVERDRSGAGQVVDAAMIDGASTLLAFLHGMHAAGQWDGARGTNLLDGGAAFYETYETSDGGYMAVGAIEPEFHAALLRGLGLEPDDAAGAASAPDPHLAPGAWARDAERFAAAFRTKSRAEWTEVFADLDACVTPVLSPWEAPSHPHHVARESFVDVSGIVQPAPAPRFSRSIPPTPQPMDAAGRDPGAALRSWGLPDAEVQHLLDSGSRPLAHSVARTVALKRRNPPHYSEEMTRTRLRSGAAVAAAGALILLVGCTVPPTPTTAPPESPAPSGTVVPFLSESVDIGDGRVMFIECAGEGGPTVILQSGIHDSSDYWVNVQPTPPATGIDVFTALAAHTTVCRYDRPGTLRPTDAGAIMTDRSTPVTNPRTIEQADDDLDALIDAAGLTAPFLLVGHSFGGWLQTYYAQTHPDDVVGLVLVDAFSDRTMEFMGDRFAAYEPVLNANPLGEDPGSEMYDVPASVALSDAAPELRQDLPMVVLSKTEPFPLPAGDLGFTSADLETAWTLTQEGLATLVPNTPHIIANGSDHYIQVREPDLVTSAILLVLERARAQQG